MNLRRTLLSAVTLAGVVASTVVGNVAPASASASVASSTIRVQEIPSIPIQMLSRATTAAMSKTANVPCSITSLTTMKTWSAYSRYDACRRLALRFYRVDLRTGRVTGEAFVMARLTTTGYPTTAQWTGEIQTYNVERWGIGFPNTARLSMGSCTGISCTASTLSKYGSSSAGWLLSYLVRTSPAAGGVLKPAQVNVATVFTVPGAPNSVVWRRASATYRCDRAVGASAGCVLPSTVPTLYYSRSVYPNVARHISLAQTSGLPGGSVSNPLRRLADVTTQRQNRQVACGSIQSPTGYSCDEYPFAATYQGAARNGGTSRVFSGCRLPQKAGSGRSGFSRCIIPAKENTIAGGALGRFVQANRILNYDRYLVRVVR